MLHPAAVETFDAIIHLAGRNVGTRWTSQVKRDIWESRVQGTQTIAKAAADAFRRTGRPGVLISVSGVGFYGSRGDEELSEASSAGTGFLAELARAWEGATQPATEAGVRVVLPRMGVVLTRRGGAMKKMLLPFQLGMGGPIGSGRQWMSWIVLEDLIRVLSSALTDTRMRGPLNAAAEQSVTNREFVRALGSALHRPAVFPLPAFIVRTIFGEMAKETLLSSTRAVPARLKEIGFSFRHPEIREAMQFAVKN
jgi:hypothetical protein